MISVWVLWGSSVCVSLQKKPNMGFKDEHTLDHRKDESSRMRQRHHDRIPVVVQRAMGETTLPDVDKKKYLVPVDMTVGQFMHVLRKRVDLPPEIAIFLFVGFTNDLPSTQSLLSALDEKYRDEDGFLYLTYQGESTFGGGVEKGFVYLLANVTRSRTYVGATKNVARRLRQHNGEIKGGARYTKSGRPWSLVASVEAHDEQLPKVADWTAALRLEWRIKHCRHGGSGKDVVERRFNKLRTVLNGDDRWCQCVLTCNE